MNFEFSQEQQHMRDFFADMLAGSCSMSVVRNVLKGETQPVLDLWQQLVDLGYISLAIPESYGGGGLSRLEQCLLAQEVGRTLAPVPITGTLYLFVEIIRACGSEKQKHALLPMLVSGKLRGAFAANEGLLDWSNSAIKAQYNNGAINGEKWPVIDAGLATHAIVVALDENTNPDLYVLELDSTTGCTPLNSIDPTRGLCRLTFNGTIAQPLENFTPKNLSLALSNAAVFIAFEQLGLADAVLKMGCDYAKQRFAFGRAIGSFQAVKHRLADMYSHIEIARSIAYYAAWAVEHQREELIQAANLALVSCNNAANFVAKENNLVHGGISFTWESDCHLYLKRAQLMSQVLGSNALFKQRIFHDMVDEVMRAS